MVEASRKVEYKKIFAEIMTSLKEYSTIENINNPQVAENEILQLLLTHRPVKLADYEFGLSPSLKENHRLIIKELEDGSKVREYSKNPYVWRCSNSFNQHNQCKSTNLEIRYGIVFTPLKHSDNCEPKNYFLVMQIQNLLKQGKANEARALAYRERKSQKESTTTDCVSSNLTPPSELSSPSSTTPVAESTRSSIKREIKEEEKDDDYCMIIDEPAAKKPKVEEESHEKEVFDFHRPSTFILKQVCKKLNIDVENNLPYYNAYRLWADILFQNIPAVANNFQTHAFKSQNIFACLSLLFTGKTDSCFLIQHVINDAFRNDLMASGSKSSDEIEQFLINNVAPDEQIEFIAKFLECRIGIYCDGGLKKFGKWEQDEEEKDILTLIFSFEAGCFSVVINLS